MSEDTNVDVIEIFPRADGDFGWRAKAANGEKVAGSEGYTERSHARRAASETFPTVTNIVDIEILDENADG